MKALTVQQPWAWAVMNKHLKHFEEPFSPKVRGYFLIHAGLGWDLELEHHLQEDRGIMVPSPLPQGSIVAYARLTSVTSRPIKRDRVKSNSFMCHNLAEIVKIEPTVAAGRRGYWLVPARMMKLLDVPLPILEYAL